jgi:hypothetical protein
MVEGSIMGRLSAEAAARCGASGIFVGEMETTDEPMRWDRARLDYLWCAWNALPDHVHFRPDGEATVILRRRFHKAHGEAFIRLAIWTYRDLGG